MALGTRKQRERQESLWIAKQELPASAAHPFYERLNGLLETEKFDEFAESACQQYYAEKMGRPGLTPGIYFRCLLVGYFEGIDSERGIAWRAADSLGIRHFLGIGLDERSPDHSTISRTRRLIALETHERIFGFVLRVIASRGLMKGQAVGVDATTLEANAAMRSIVRRDSGESYQEFLTGLAKESGIETPTREQLAKLDRKRKKRMSNQDWEHPQDPDAKITKMKDGSTHLAHKAEHAVDLETGAIIAVTVQGADEGDTATITETVAEAGEWIAKTAEAVNGETGGERVNPEGPAEVVADKGYHSNAVLRKLSESGVRGYIPEPDRGERNWKGKAAEQKAVYANRRRVQGTHGKRLMRRRGEYIERSFAHLYETGAMRRTHLRGRDNVRKRLLIHASAFNLSLVFRNLFKAGTPRGCQGRKGTVLSAICTLLATLTAIAGNLSISVTTQNQLRTDKYFSPGEPVLLAA